MKKLCQLMIVCCLAQAGNKLQAQECNTTLTVASGDSIQSVCFGEPIIAITFLTNATAFNVTGLPTGINVDLTGGLLSIFGMPAISGNFSYSINFTGECTGKITGRIIVKALPTAVVSLNGPANICQGQSSGIRINFTGTAPWSGTLQNNDPFNAVGNPLLITVTPASSTNYRLVRLTDASGCASTPGGLTGNASVTVNPIPAAPEVTSIVTYCQGATATSLNATGTNLLWYTTLSGGAGTTTAPIPSTITAGTTSYYVSQTSNGCESPRAVINVTVNATPVINAIRDTAFCNGGFVSNGIAFTSVPEDAVFTWTNNNINIGLGSGATGNIPPFIANNINSVADSAIINVSAVSRSGNCRSSADRVFKIKIQAGPSFTSRTDTSICDGALFRYTASSSAVGTSFKWQRILPAGVTGLTLGSDTSTATVNDRLDNSTARPLIVQYVFRLSTGSACVTNGTLNVVVYPTPEINAIGARTYCNNEFVTEGILFTSNSPDTVISWQIIAALPIEDSLLGLPGRSGIGSIPPFVAKNNTGSDQTITIRVSISVNNRICTGTSRDFNITVRPGPSFTSRRDTSICDGALFRYTATSSAVGTSFRWQRILPAGVTGLTQGTDTSSATVNDRLDNSTARPLIVQYVFRLSTGSACVTNGTLNVVVYPTPEINAIGARTYCNNEFVTEGILFTSNSPDTVISWQIIAALPIEDSLLGFPGRSGIGSIPPFVAKNNTGSDQTIAIRVSISVNNRICTGASKDFNITVRPGPLFTSRRDTSICDNALFRYTATSSAAGTSFKWQRILPAGVTGLAPGADTLTAAVNDRLDNGTAGPLTVQYVFQLSTGSACVTTGTLNVVVYPTPELNEIGARTYCNNEFVNGGILFTSNSPDTVISWQIIAALPIEDSLLGLPGRSGIGSIPPFIAKNYTSSNQTITIRVSISVNNRICTGASKDFNITVRPGPSFTSRRDTSICDNALFRYTATSSAAGTSFKWQRILPAGVTGLNPGTDTSTAIINDRPDNSTDTSIAVKYVFTLTTGSGDGCVSVDSLNVIVDPTPVIDTVRDTTFCSGAFVGNGIPFTSKSSPNVIFTWRNNNTSIGLDSSGTGSIPPFVPVNSTTDTSFATITVSAMTGNGICPGAGSRIFIIKVLPVAVFTSRKDTAICNNASFTYVATSSAAGTSFKWTRILPAGVSGLTQGTDTSTATVNDRLENSTAEPLNVKYIFTLTTGNGCDTSQTLNITVNPTPQIDPAAIQHYSFCNGISVDSIVFKSATPNVSFTWACDTSIGFGRSGNGQIPSFTTINNGVDSIVATVIVKISVGIDNCAGRDTSFTITVYPTPKFIGPGIASVCNTAQFNYGAISSVGNANTIFHWQRNLPPTLITGVPTGNAGDTPNIIDTLYNTGTQPGFVKYYFNLATRIGGCFNSDSLRLTVNPTPEIDASVIHRYSFCNGVSVDSIIFRSNSPNASFKWTCDTTIGFGKSCTGNIPAFTATNNGTDSIVATVRVSITASSDNCPGRDTSFTITVNPSPSQPDFTWLDLHNGTLCSGTENINFNVTSPLTGISYLWTSVLLTNPNVSIRDTNDVNTVISFLKPATETIRVIATNTGYGGCTDTVSHTVNVTANLGIIKRQIIIKQPGNLLIYPDNSLDTLTGYQWGYDSVIVKDASFGQPIPVQGQVYQFFVPENRFITNDVLDTISRSFWVLLRQGDCYTKVYYNGPYSWARPVITLPEDNTVQLQVAPNPNNGIFDIVLKGNIYGNIDAKIYNSMGQLVMNKNFVKTTPHVKERLETEKLPNGLYYLLLNSSDLKKAVTRFVIQH
ncbi:MAG: PKD-like domain-containing protein [Ferruginibacter sp.]